MIAEIKSVKDVELFTKQIIAEGVSIHPDDDFGDMINIETNLTLYSAAEAEKRNNLMNQAFSVCENSGVDIYDTMMEILLKETRLDSVIPLPSTPFNENLRQ